MKKEADKIYEEIIDVYKKSVQSLEEITLNTIEFYYARYRALELELELQKEKKPNKIFKKNLKKWKEQNEILEKEKKYILTKITLEIKELNIYK